MRSEHGQHRCWQHSSAAPGQPPDICHSRCAGVSRAYLGSSTNEGGSNVLLCKHLLNFVVLRKQCLTRFGGVPQCCTEGLDKPRAFGSKGCLLA
eukprot:1146218-Pelagomonas_calceolata.AAC.8